MTKQVQKGGDHSKNIQAGQLCITTHGIGYEEARQIAIDVFKANYLQLSEEALEKVFIRTEEITDQFFKKLREQNEEGITRAREPDFQYALYTVKKEYARTGDKELGDLLVDLLVDRTKHENRTILEIVLNESLSVAPKITNEQLAALSILFIFKYTINNLVTSLNAMGDYFDKYIYPFAEVISKKAFCYQYLVSIGCASMITGAIYSGNMLHYIIKRNYDGLFVRGFSQDDLIERNIKLPITSTIFTRCIHDPKKYQANAISEKVLRQTAIEQSIDKDEIDKLVHLNNSCSMNADDVRQYIESFRPYMKNVFDVWINSPMQYMNLTSIGIAIGHANVKRMLGEFPDLSIWIN